MYISWCSGVYKIKCPSTACMFCIYLYSGASIRLPREYICPEVFYIYIWSTFCVYKSWCDLVHVIFAGCQNCTPKRECNLLGVLQCQLLSFSSHPLLLRVFMLCCWFVLPDKCGCVVVVDVVARITTSLCSSTLVFFSSNYARDETMTSSVAIFIYI